MLFSQIEFFVFAAIVLGFLLLVKHHKVQKLFLLAASYYFYAYWNWRFLGLIFTTTAVTYICGQALKRTEQESSRRTYLIIALVINLGILGFFKYYNFFTGSLAAILMPLGMNVKALHIILPVGISFYTFQALSYVIDVYRHKLEACDDFLDFALFVGFFPQLVAGPIVRAADFLPQLQSVRQMSWPRAYDGFRQFTYGLFKKVFIADRIAPFVDTVFGNPGVFDGTTTWLAVLAYALQIYCDFSGYSDMAIGVARIMGYDFMENFNHPYIATRLDDFWHRWHISLSTWLRDYLYIPLGGNRKGKMRTHINLMVTMILGGLWHGAAWTFVFWGTLHGVGLCVTKLLASKSKANDPPRNWFTGLIGWAVTFLITNVAWVYFRSQSFPDAMTTLRQMFAPGPGTHWIHPFVAFALALMILNQIVHRLGGTHLIEVFQLKEQWVYSPAVLLSMWWLVLVFYPTEFAPFIYFQF